MPEPSPLFWPHFSERVRTAIDSEALPESTWPSWLRWQVLLPLGAVAMIVLGLMISVPKQDRAEREVSGRRHSHRHLLHSTHRLRSTAG